MSARTNKVAAPIDAAPIDNATLEKAPLENADSGIVRVPYDAITRPLADRHEDGVTAGFVAEQRLADLLFRRRIRRAGRGMIFCDGRIYELHEAVRVVGPRDDKSDPYGLAGTVERLDELRRAGASIGQITMHLGSTTYRIERGVLAVPPATGDSLAG